MIVLGLDISLTATGWAKWPAGETGVITSQPQPDRIRRFIKIAEEIDILLEDASHIAIEGYSFGSQGRIYQLGELGGIVRSGLLSFPMVEIPPTLLKKFCCNKGNAKKDEMRLGVYKNWKRECKTEHEIDAFGLAVMGYHFFSKERCGNVYQDEALEKLRAMRFPQ